MLGSIHQTIQIMFIMGYISVYISNLQFDISGMVKHFLNFKFEQISPLSTDNDPFLPLSYFYSPPSLLSFHRAPTF